MTVPVVEIRKVRMSMHQRLMVMYMQMRFSTVPREIMFVLVMQVMCVSVRMCRRFVRMLVIMTLGQMQPDSDAHEKSGDPESSRERFVECHDGNGGTDERRC